MYIPRYIEKHAAHICDTFKVLYVGGPRQVGKTTMLQHLSRRRNMQYVTLDDLDKRKLAKNDPQLFLEEHSAPLFIDEVQYAPELFPYIKMRVDQSNGMGQYWMTGSQHFALMQNVQESLAGRVGILHLLGLSLAEIHRLPDVQTAFLPGAQTVHTIPDMAAKQLFAAIVRGSYPRLWQANPPDPADFYKAYLQTYVDRDVRVLFGVGKTQEFHTFVRLCAARTGQLLNMTDLARDAGVSLNAAREWLSILESTMQIYLLRPYYRNITKRDLKAPKLYMLDTGLAAHLAGWQEAEALRHSAYAGAFFETFVISEIVKSYLFRGQDPPLYYFRDKQGHEVDALIEHAQKVHPIEIKMKKMVTDDDLRGINYVRDHYPETGHGAVITLNSGRHALNRHTDSLPPIAIQ